MTAGRRVLGGLAGVLAGCVLTLVPVVWDVFVATHQMRVSTALFLAVLYAPAAVPPSLVGLGVGQSLPERIRRNAKSRPGS